MISPPELPALPESSLDETLILSDGAVAATPIIQRTQSNPELQSSAGMGSSRRSISLPTLDSSGERDDTVLQARSSSLVVEPPTPTTPEAVVSPKLRRSGRVSMRPDRFSPY